MLNDILKVQTMQDVKEAESAIILSDLTEVQKSYLIKVLFGEKTSVAY